MATIGESYLASRRMVSSQTREDLYSRAMRVMQFRRQQQSDAEEQADRLIAAIRAQATDPTYIRNTTEEQRAKLLPLLNHAEDVRGLPRSASLPEVGPLIMADLAKVGEQRANPMGDFSTDAGIIGVGEKWGWDTVAREFTRASHQAQLAGAQVPWLTSVPGPEAPKVDKAVSGPGPGVGPSLLTPQETGAAQGQTPAGEIAKTAPSVPTQPDLITQLRGFIEASTPSPMKPEQMVTTYNEMMNRNLKTGGSPAEAMWAARFLRRVLMVPGVRTDADERQLAVSILNIWQAGTREKPTPEFLQWLAAQNPKQIEPLIPYLSQRFNMTPEDLRGAVSVVTPAEAKAGHQEALGGLIQSVLGHIMQVPETELRARPGNEGLALSQIFEREIPKQARQIGITLESGDWATIRPIGVELDRPGTQAQKAANAAEQLRLSQHREARAQAGFETRQGEPPKATGGLIQVRPGVVLQHDAAEAFRAFEAELGHRIGVTSSWRSQQHNAEVKGAVHSNHLWGGSFDVGHRRLPAAVEAIAAKHGFFPLPGDDGHYDYKGPITAAPRAGAGAMTPPRRDKLYSILQQYTDLQKPMGKAAATPQLRKLQAAMGAPETTWRAMTEGQRASWFTRARAAQWELMKAGEQPAYSMGLHKNLFDSAAVAADSAGISRELFGRYFHLVQ
jgi:hypothetical protein